jgi:DNA-binding MarR family transcriptional regulator
MATKKEVMDNLASAMQAIYTFDKGGEKFSVVDLMVLSEICLKPGLTLTETMTKYNGIVPIATIQHSFAGFDKRGLIDKKPHPTEYRAKAVYLSRKGEDLINKIVGEFR